MPRSNPVSRRTFLSTAAAGTAAILAAPAIATDSKTGQQLIIGEGDYKYEVQHNFPQLPEPFTWQTTHNVAVDKSGNLYVIHEGNRDLKDHPSIFVFDNEGKYIRSFGAQFQGGGHGIEIRQEGSEEFIYVCAYQRLKTFAKMTLQGGIVWQQYAPMQSGVYAEGENIRYEDKSEPNKDKQVWGGDHFLPTNFAFLDDGGFLLVDGYGASYVHRYDKDGRWQSCFGGVGEENGKFKTPHGIWVDKREGREPSIVICDRAHNQLQIFTMDGQYKETITGFGLPANVETWKNLMIVPELKARVSLLNEKNEVVARLGDDVARINGEGGGAIRNDASKWIPGKFVHPHDACFTLDGSIYVAEWVSTGRVSKLKRLG
ncbi:MAG: hypothetical protein DWH81_02290 [Planctomycetota bacterium]|nr:MAG: hypothetical protein DWH81_02290 [Planctomycetota bacterium]